MKNLKLLPLVAMISGLMVGCGSEGGGGSSYVAPSPTYTFTFVKSSITYDEHNGCTVFDKSKDDSGKDTFVNYYSIGNVSGGFIKAYYTDDKNNQTNIELNNSGQLIIPKNDIPDNGSVTIQEITGPDINAVTFSKSVLDNSVANNYLSISAPVPLDSLTCLRGNNDGIVTKTTDLDYVSPDNVDSSLYKNPYDQFYFDSQMDHVRKSSSRFESGDYLKAIDGEPTIITKFLDKNKIGLYLYGYSDHHEMLFADKSDKLKADATLMTFKNVNLFTIYDDFNYFLGSLNVGDAYQHPELLTFKDNWAYNTTGTITSAPSWTATYYDKIDDTQWNMQVDDQKLFTLTNINATNEPTVLNNVIDLSSSIALGSESGLQRIAYRTEITGSPYIVRHVLYTKIREKVVVPNLDYSMFNLSKSKIDELKVSDNAVFSQSYAFTTSSNLLDLEDFMTNFGGLLNGATDFTIALDPLGLVKNLKEKRIIKNKVMLTKSLWLDHVEQSNP